MRFNICKDCKESNKGNFAFVSIFFFPVPDGKICFCATCHKKTDGYYKAGN